MKKKYLIGLMMCVTFVSVGICNAKITSDYKKQARQELMEGCVAGAVTASNRSSKAHVREETVLKFCLCVIDKALKNYSAADLKAMEKDMKKAEKFAKDMEQAMLSQECWPLMQIQKK